MHRIPSPECTRNRRFRSARDFSRPRQHRPQPVPGSPSESQPVPASPTRCSGRLERAGAGRVTRCVTEMHTIKPASNWKEGNRKMPRRASRACSRRNPTGNLPCNTANGLQRELQLHSASTHTSLPHTTRPGRSDRCQGRNEAQHAPPGHSCAEIRDCTLEAHPRSWISWVLDARSKKNQKKP